MTRYVYRDGTWRDSAGNPMDVPDRIATPMFASDIEPYKSPIDGRVIGGRAARRDDLARNNCVPYEPMGNAPKGLKNPKYAQKHGVMHLLSEEVRDQQKIRIKR